MRLEFIWVGKTKDPDVAGIEKKYLKRIGSYSPVDVITIAEQDRRDKHQQQRANRQEANQLEKHLSRGKYLVVLDEKGKQPTSLELASWLRDWMEQGLACVTFLVGGHAGVPPRIRRQAHRTLSLSRMTLTHEMARILLLEQIYRAIMILKGSPYHRSAHPMEG